MMIFEKFSDNSHLDGLAELEREFGESVNRVGPPRLAKSANKLGLK